MKVNERVGVQMLCWHALLHGIQLQKVSWGQWKRSLRILMPLLPLRVPGTVVPPEHSFHRGKTHREVFRRESVMENLGALASLPTEFQDAGDHLSGELPGMMEGSGGTSGDHHPSISAVLGFAMNPLCHCALGISKVPGCLTSAPPAVMH